MIARAQRAALLIGLISVASTASAQTWQAIGTPSNANTGAYWNNTSDDNVGTATCNVGAILTNTPALTPASCANQVPNPLLPLTPAPLTTSNTFLGFGASGSNPGGFGFAAGSYNFGFIGRVEGTPTPAWGIVTSSGTVISAATLLTTSATAGGINIGGPFAIWIQQVLPVGGAGTVFTSGQSTFAGGTFTASTNQQFAVFTNAFGVGSGGLSSGFFGTIINANPVQTFYVGMEDNVCNGRGFTGCTTGPTSDRDYNDIMIRVTAVPEPATVGMMALGLMALTGLAARRRRA